MPYNPKRDFISVGGEDFTNILDGDSAFQYNRRSDKYTTRRDSGGGAIRFENTDIGGTGQISVRWDATSAIKLLSNLLKNGKETTLQRDNRNPGGEKTILSGVVIQNEGQKGKSSDGTLSARTFNFEYETEVNNEGAY